MNVIEPAFAQAVAAASGEALHVNVAVTRHSAP
jgi:hypothetical protein